jgi:hypothetical protein
VHYRIRVGDLGKDAFPLARRAARKRTRHRFLLSRTQGREGSTTSPVALWEGIFNNLRVVLGGEEKASCPPEPTAVV